MQNNESVTAAMNLDLTGWTLVFDLDGTLVDTAPDLIASLNFVMKKNGWPTVPIEIVHNLVGNGAVAMIKRGLEIAGLDQDQSINIDQLLAQFLDHYGSHLTDKSSVFPGLPDALDLLQDRGAKLAVCTNKVEDLSVRLLTELNFADRFEVICGRDTFEYCKPDGRHILSTLDRAGGVRDKAIMVGDSQTDILAAKDANIPVIAVTFGYTQIPIADLEPDTIIESYNQLVPCIDEII